VRVRRIAPSRTGDELGGQLTRYEGGQLIRRRHWAEVPVATLPTLAHHEEP
jgi:hypothetical protein